MRALRSSNGGNQEISTLRCLLPVTRRRGKSPLRGFDVTRAPSLSQEGVVPAEGSIVHFPGFEIKAEATRLPTQTS